MHRQAETIVLKALFQRLKLHQLDLMYKYLVWTTTVTAETLLYIWMVDIMLIMDLSLYIKHNQATRIIIKYVAAFQ